MKIFIIFIINCLACGASALTVDCVGDRSLTKAAVYLHGMTNFSLVVGPTSVQQRLTNISQKLGIGFAMPRAEKSCGADAPNSVCWAWGAQFADPQVLMNTVAIAEQAVAACFDQARAPILIGFSNGGYMTNRIFRYCQPTSFKKFITFAAGGTIYPEQTGDLSTCGAITILAGRDKDESNFQNIQEFAAWLITRGASLKFVEFAGGHTVNEAALETALRDSLHYF